MIYLVSNQAELFESDEYKHISIEESLTLLRKCKRLQYDSETDGKDAHICNLLCIQFGSKRYKFQLVIDISTIDILIYKNIFLSKRIIGHNLKFDLQFLYKYKIVPKKIYDTMIVEQLLHLGYPAGILSNSLASICERRLGVILDKSIRSEIVRRGLDTQVIKYAANDVKYLEDIMELQLKECQEKRCIKGAILENNFVKVIAYLEWSGIKLDVNKWKQKMEKDLKGLILAKQELDNFVINNPLLKEFTTVNTQGDLFSGFDTEPKCNVLWSSSKQVIPVAKKLGFNVTIKDKKTGEDKETVIEKHLKKQKGINDEFLRLYLGKGEEDDEDYFPGHQGMNKLVTSFGQGHLNAINPITGRIHTIYRQLGTDTGRMSSGSKQNNSDLAKLKGLPINPSDKQKREGLGCSYPNMQQLPHDAFTRSCFVSEENNMWVSCDYSAIESRLGADIYREKAMIEEFLHGSGDMHSLVAKMIFEELKDVPVKDIKKKFPHLRNDAKPVEFSQQFGGTAHAIRNAMGCSLEKAEKFAKAYSEGFKNIAKFKEAGANFVKKYGYINLCPYTGHKTYWYKWKECIDRQNNVFTSSFWDDYRENHKGTGDSIHLMVKDHFKEVSKWERKALNSPTQGEGAVILKDSQIRVFDWVVKNNYFDKILLCNLTHDEANWEYPKELTDFPKILQKCMEDAAGFYCKSLPIPAEPEIGKCWIH